jgi:hypothetical protein
MENCWLIPCDPPLLDILQKSPRANHGDTGSRSFFKVFSVSQCSGVFGEWFEVIYSLMSRDPIGLRDDNPPVWLEVIIGEYGDFVLLKQAGAGFTKNVHFKPFFARVSPV